MSQPLFATYTTDENRVSGSLMAVLERLSLTTLQRLLSEATEEDVPLVEFRTQPRNPHGPGVPDGAITASVLYLVEAKVKPDTVGLEQLQRHLAWLDGSTASHGRLYVLTPDRGKPPVLQAFAEDERVVWLSYLALDDAIASVLDLPIDEVTERERFLLRELANMFRQEGLVGGFDTVVVAGRISWPEYLEFGIYACQAQRAFRDVPYLGFYADGEIKPLLARRLAWWPEIRFDAATAADLAADVDPLKQRLGEAIPAILASTERGPREAFGVMLLSPPDDVATLRVEPLRHIGRGAWTQAQRYTSSELLVSGPADTAQLDAWEQERGLR